MSGIDWDDDEDDLVNKPRNRVVFSVQKVGNGFVVKYDAETYVFLSIVGVNTFIAELFKSLEWEI